LQVYGGQGGERFSFSVSGAIGKNSGDVRVARYADGSVNVISETEYQEFVASGVREESSKNCCGGQQGGIAENATLPPWPFPGAFFGKLRHLTGPDAISIGVDIDLVAPNGGAVITPIAALLILKGPKKGSVELLYDIGVGVGIDISLAGKITELYFNGDANDINSDTFTGIRVEAEAAVTFFGFDFGKGGSYSPDPSYLLKNAVFGLSTSIGVGIPVPFAVSGNGTVGYTGNYSQLFKAIKNAKKRFTKNKK
jgi:hypothetical protein